MGLHKNTRPNANFLTVKHSSICLELKPIPDTPEKIEQALKDGYEEKTVKDPSKKNPDGTDVYVTKYVKLFGALSGRIKNIEWYDSKETYKTRFLGVKIKLRDENNETFILDLNYGTKAYDVFTRVMENIDYSKDVSFSAWHDKKSDSTAFVVRQDGNTVKWRYTREYNQQILDQLMRRHELPVLAEAFRTQVVEAGDQAFISQALREELEKNGYAVAPLPIKNELDKWNFDSQKAWLYKRLVDIVIPKVKELNPDFDELLPEATDEAPVEQTQSPAEITQDPAPATPSPVPAESAAAVSAASEPASPPLSPVRQEQEKIAAQKAAMRPPYGTDDDIPF